MDEQSREGWAPEIGREIGLEEVIEAAFDYRGNVTVELSDGRELVGYLFNRNAQVSDPFVEMFDVFGRGPHRVRYAEIRRIRFTGKDQAAGRTYEAWKRKQASQPDAAPAPGGSDDR